MAENYDQLESKIADKENPKKNANIFSLLSFWWVRDILVVGNKRPLENDDLFPLLDEDKTQSAAEKLERTWFEETAKRVPGKKGNGYRLFRALVRMFPWTDHMFVQSLFLVDAVCNLLQPVFLSLLLQELIRSSWDHLFWQAYIYAAGICLSSWAHAIAAHQAGFHSLLMAVRWRSATIAVLYKKVLSLTQVDVTRITSGYIVNLVATDLQRFEKSIYSLYRFFRGLFELCGASLVIVFLFGWKVLSGIVFMILLTLYYGIAGRICTTLQSQISKLADRRISVMNSIIPGIRTVKMNAWEWPFMERVQQTRKHEIKLITWKTGISATFATLTFCCQTIAAFISLVTMVATGMELTSYNTFVILSLVSLLKTTITFDFGQSITILADFAAALSRIQNTLEFENSNVHKYLEETFAKSGDIKSSDDQYWKDSHFVYKDEITHRKLRHSSDKADLAVFMKDVTCSWSGSSNKLSLKSVSLSVEKGDLVFIAGPVGCGKSSLLYAILQELPLFNGSISSHGKIALVSQQPWVFSGTIRENILFGEAFDPRRYQMVLEACALFKDLQRFPDGDLARVGERGIVLSGGQQARVELARAVYYNADIYLLDDPLSAVDAKVGNHIFNECIDKILQEKTRLIVTHNLQVLRYVENIVVMKNGSIVGQGDLSSLLRSGLHFSEIEYSRENESTLMPNKSGSTDEENENEAISHKTSAGLDNMEEDREVGSISWKIYWHLIQAGIHPVLAAVLLIFCVLVQASLILPDWWLLQLTSRSHDRQRQTKDLFIYGYLVCAAVLLSVMRAATLLNTLINSSKNLHNTMLSVVLRAPVLFFDTNPAGRILNRFSRDIGILDELLPDSFLKAVQILFFAFATVVLQTLLNPWIVLPATPLTVISILISRYFLKSSRDLRRLEAINRSPVLSHFSDTLEGLVTVRAYKREDAFLQKLYRFQDEHNKVWFAISSTDRWLGFVLDMICVIFVTFVIYLAIATHAGSGVTALSIVYALQLVAGTFQYGVKQCSEVESYMTSVERVLAYTQIDPEPGYEDHNQPPENWPLHGEVRTRDLGLVYYHGGPQILKDVSFAIDPQEKVGIVGRTGAGKSSLIAALFRIPQPTGDVVIDDVKIGEINIQSARRAVAVITQNPVLFTGPLRMNLDPFDEYADKELWDALEEASLKSMVRNLPQQLNEEVKESGANLSVGERQLLCLARALLKKNKIIVLDEATANVDYKTDQLIQETIRTKFKHCTVITIAHRLNTIMDYDRVLVLEHGRVVEFDKPEILLRNRNGVFFGLYYGYMDYGNAEN